MNVQLSLRSHMNNYCIFVGAPEWSFCLCLIFFAEIRLLAVYNEKKRKRKRISISTRTDLSMPIDWGSSCFFFLLTLLNCFVECFYLVCTKIVSTCQKSVRPFPRWPSVGPAKPWRTLPVGTLCDYQITTGAKHRSVTCTITHGMWTAAVELGEFARVIGRVFQWKQERLWIILPSIFTS